MEVIHVTRTKDPLARRVSGSYAVALALTSLLIALPPWHAGARTRSTEIGGEQTIRIRPDPEFRGGLGPVSSAGDVNGDGIRDVLIGACRAAYNGSFSGAVYVVFGRTEPGEIRLDQPGFGFRIDGSEEAGACVPGEAGDVNGDGLADIIVGAPGRNAAYVVFGKPDENRVDLRLFDLDLQLDAGFRIDGAYGGAITGDDVDGVGDMNGDGLGDVAVSAPFIGTTYVVFGKRDGKPVSLRELHEESEPTLTQRLLGEEPARQGFRIDTPEPRIYNTYSVAGAGDVNGDGVPDVVIGVTTRIRSPGKAFVVYGKASFAPVDVTKMAPRTGFAIKSHASGNGFGSDAVDGAGDVNGDGYQDIIVGAAGRSSAYVIYGGPKRSEVDVRSLADNGFRLWHPGKGDSFGLAVAGVGDIDGDGRSDVAIGAGRLKFRGRPTGGVYLIFGGKEPKSANVTKLSTRRGFLLGGGGIGFTLAGAGDVSGDSVPDLMLGTPRADNNRGTAFVVFLRST